MITAEHNIFDETDGQKEHDVIKVVVHQNYNSSTLRYDYAILKVYPEIEFSDKAIPICLPEKTVEESFDSQTTQFTVSGWGLREGQHGKKNKLCFQN